MGDETGEKALVILDRLSGSGLSLMFFLQPVFMTECGKFGVVLSCPPSPLQLRFPFSHIWDSNFLGGVGIKCINDESGKVFLEDIPPLTTREKGTYWEAPRNTTPLWPNFVSYCKLCSVPCLVLEGVGQNWRSLFGEKGGLGTGTQNCSTVLRAIFH